MKLIWKNGFVVVGLLLLLLPANLWGKEIPVIRVAAFNYYPAIFLDSDNQVRGFYVDMLDEIAAREPIRFEYVFGSWSEGLERLRSGDVDLVTSAAYTEERATFMDYGQQALLTVWGELYLPQDSPIVPIKDLQDKRIAVMRGDHNARSFEEHLSKFGVNSQFMEYADFDEVFGAIKDQQVSAGVVNSVFGDAAAQKYLVQSSGIAFNPFDIYFASATGQHAELLSLLDDYLYAWRNDSTSVYFQSRLAWGATQDPEEFIPAWVVSLAIAAAVLLLIGLIFIVLLRYRVHRATRRLKKNEAELQKSNNMIRLLLDSTAEGIYGVDPQGICTFCNAACVGILGYDNADQLIGRNMHDLIHHSHVDGAAMPATKCKLLKGLDRKIHCDSEVFWRADGISFPVEYWSYPVLQEGKSIGLVVSFVDITERKRADEAFALQSKLLEKSQALANLGSWEWDIRHDRWFFSEQWKKIHGASENDLEASKLFEIAHPQDAPLIEKAFTDAKELKKIYDIEHRIIRVDNKEIRYIKALGEVEFDQNTGCPIRMVGASQDITERKQAQLALQKKNEELEQFVYSVSHDLKSPLVTVKTFAGMLRQDLLNADQPQINEDLNYIDKAADKMQLLLDALLRYSRIGRIDTPAQTVSVDQQVQNCLAALAGILQQHQVRISTDDLPHQLHGNPLQFGQIWQNLIENAVKYRGDQAHPHIEIGATQQGHDVVFYVRDNGIGIAPEHRERIFNLFSQLNPGSDGSGLGLALVKKIVSIYRGRIWVESAGAGQGSCFMFTLPAARKRHEVTE